jgi:hypothetical protein
MADYDHSNKQHVAALAAALGLGTLEWSTRRDPDNAILTLLVCRFPDRREYFMPTVSSSPRDVDRFVAGVSMAILADVEG